MVDSENIDETAGYLSFVLMILYNNLPLVIKFISYNLLDNKLTIEL